MNPFVQISPVTRLVLVSYFLLWQILPEAVFGFRVNTTANQAVAAALFCRIATDLILLVPFVIQRIGRTPTGWIHPLILPGLLVAALTFVRDPTHILEPIRVWLVPTDPPNYRITSNWSEASIRNVELKRDFMFLLATISYFAGFLLYIPKKRIRRPRTGSTSSPPSDFAILAAMLLCFLVFALFMQLNGGLLTHMSNLALGRFNMRESAGHFLVVIQFAPYLAVFWYLLKPKIFWRSWFLAIFIGSLIMQFVATGSRTTMVMPAVVMMAAWIIVNRKVPIAASIGMLMSAVLFLGVLGEVRNSSWRNQGEINFSALLNFDLVRNIETTRKEADARAANSGIMAIMAKVPDEAPYLYGLSYVSAGAFFVPRSIWRDKPRAAGAYVNGMLYGGLDKNGMRNFRGAGFPAGGVGEAYFNFGLLGVIVIHFLFGAFHKWICHWAIMRRGEPEKVIIYLLSLVLILSPASISIVSFLQVSVLLMITVLVGRKFSPSVRHAIVKTYGPKRVTGHAPK